MPHKPKRLRLLKQKVVLLTLAGVVASSMLISCGQTVHVAKDAAVPASKAAEQKPQIYINQVGFLPNDHKVAVISPQQSGAFTVVSQATGQVVLNAKLQSKGLWPLSEENVSIADFSDLSQEGAYRLELADGKASALFSVGSMVYRQIHDASLKAYYFNRASMALSPEFAGPWARSAGHPDTQVKIHVSAASDARPTNTIISAPKGWYDAGDYGKYVVNSGISTYTLLLAYTHFKDFYQKRDGHIPESSDGLPDILNEVMWNLDWLQAMQDPNDGGVYHKLTTLNFAGSVMPENAHEQRYVVQKSTAATLNFAAVMAFASQVYQEFDRVYPGKSAAYKKAALGAWQWAKTHPEILYLQPEDVKTGAYGDKTLADEFAFAAAQLFVLTGDNSYLNEFLLLDQTPQTPSWSHTASLGYFTLLSFAQDLMSAKLYQQLENKLIKQANVMVAQLAESAYEVPLIKSDFVWGSNAVAMNKAMLLLIANQHKPNPEFRHGAVALTDYILGRNPTGYSYVTGFGQLSPMHIHHRQSEADDVVAPVPGFLAGGAQNGWQDQCNYPSKAPATSYIDDFCSYSTNEIAINWNAPLVYVLAALQSQTMPY
ncbi:MAG: glycoside hydrolase family 9 protein [Paraglaciecola sp.]|nr:glycoside hydrolase family 9 protein [Paraglaciecola sp.]